MKLFRKAEDAKDNARRPDGDNKAGSGRDFDVAAAGTTKTGEDRDNDLSAPSPEPGTDTPTELKGKGLFAAVKRTFKQFSEDNISDWAAALTYYGLLSIFPGLLVLVSILGMLSNNGQQTVQSTVREVAPSQQLQSLVQTVLSQVQDPGKAGIAALIGIAVAFWSASGYIAAFMRASNAIYD